MANNGWISIIKVSLEAYGHYASNYHFRIFKNQKFNSKRAPKFQKSRTYIRRLQIKNLYKTDPPKSGNFDAKYNFQIFKNQK